MRKKIKPGIYERVPFDEYASWDAVNNTALSYMGRSPAHFRAFMAGELEKDSDAMFFGRLIHMSKLDPMQLGLTYAVLDEDRLAAEALAQRDANGQQTKAVKLTTEYKKLVEAFTKANEGREIVTRDDYERAVQLVTALAANERARTILESGQATREVSVVVEDPETGLLLKARFDVWNRQVAWLCDLKSTRDASRFGWSMFDYGYHRQAAFYVHVARLAEQQILGDDPTTETFIIVAVEKEAPFGCLCAPVADSAIQAGRAEYRRLLRQVAECQQRDAWPCYENPEAFDMPPGAYGQLPVVVEFQGQQIFVQ